jgi:2-hydroxymuconate-semialdehyde hydrolase
VTVQAPEATRLDVAGVPTALIDVPAAAPAGGPPVLLLHGSGPGVTATANWRPVIPALSQDRRVLAPDQLGFGGTATGEPRTYGRAAWTAHALALLEELGTGPVDIMGNSMGGAVALSIAAARPETVRRIVLMGSMGVAMALPAGVSSAQLIDLLPDSRLHILSGCGHWTMIEKTAEFLAVVRPFLAP